MKKILLISLFLISAIFLARFLVGGNEDNWICQNGEWVKHGNPSSPKPEGGCGESLTIKEPSLTPFQLKLDIPAGWKTFVNEDFKFALGYPDKLRQTDSNCLKNPWSYSEKYVFDKKGNYQKTGWLYHVAFGPSCTKAGGLVWGINVYDSVDPEELIQKHGAQFADRKEKRQQITLNGVNAILITVTTNEYNDWISKAVLIQSGNRIYEIGNGAEDLIEFETFYKSFKLFD